MHELLASEIYPVPFFTQRQQPVVHTGLLFPLLCFCSFAPVISFHPSSKSQHLRLAVISGTTDLQIYQTIQKCGCHVRIMLSPRKIKPCSFLTFSFGSSYARSTTILPKCPKPDAKVSNPDTSHSKHAYSFQVLTSYLLFK